MSILTPRTIRRAASIASITMLGIGASACVPEPAPVDNSHTSSWASATFSSELRNTLVEIAAGIDDPAGGNLGKQLQVRLTQSWCDVETLVERTLEGDASTFGGDVKVLNGTASVAGTVALTGEETRTPAGPGCASPQTGSAITAPVTIGSTVEAEIRGGGTVVRYTRDDGGEYTYEDSSATGGIDLANGEGSFDFTSSVAAGTWLWQGFWADARGLDIDTLLPV